MSMNPDFLRALPRCAVAIVCALLTMSACGSENSPATTTAAFAEFPWQRTEPDVRRQRLCVEAADPDYAADTTHIHCAIEGATFAPARVPPRADIVVLAYNIARGFAADAQLARLRDGTLPAPDVLLLSEVDRGCARTAYRNVARDYARALGYAYVFATEFVELPATRGPSGPYDPPLCEHGNAIVSRYPLGNVRAIRHARNRSWYTPPDEPNPDEPRLGGRIALAADMRVGRRLVRLYVLHLESEATASRIRTAQAQEIAADALPIPYPVIVGGDLNAYGAIFDLEYGGATDGPTQAFLTQGFDDAHAPLPTASRITNFDPVPLIIDFVFARGATVSQPGICLQAQCGDLSDHLPIWTTVRLDG